MQRLGDQLLVDVRPVGIRGIEEIHAELHRTAQHAVRVRAVFRRPPNRGAADAHRAVAQAVHFQVTELDA